MPAFKDLSNQKFGRLFVKHRVMNNKIGAYFTCICDCGNNKEIRGTHLTSGNTVSCGCYNNEKQYKNIVGKKYGQLLVIAEAEQKNKQNYFLCKCDCEVEKSFSGKDLRNGKLQSCGCSKLSKDPQKISIMEVYRTSYNDGNVTIDEFIKLSQKNCYYCNIEPLNNFNKLINKKDVTLKSKENANFNYNGIDRINSDLPHDINNVVPCCKQCNQAKSNMSLVEFKKNIIDNYNKFSSLFTTINENKYLNLLNDDDFKNQTKYRREYHPAITSARKIFKNTYDDGSLLFARFLNLSQQNCVYCDSVPINKYNCFKHKQDSSEYARQNGDFIYNGLDRVDPNKPHDIDNIVPCCFRCNWSKSNNTLEEYKDWIVRVYNHLIKQ